MRHKLAAPLAEFEFRTAHIGDVPALARLAAVSFPTPWSRDMIASSLMAPGACAVCAMRSQSTDCGGALIWRAVADEAEIQFLAVVPQWRRHGLASSLLARGLTALDRAGIAKVYLEVAQSNHAAQKLYNSAGFATVGQRENYYDHGREVRENALIMRRNFPLTAGPCDRAGL